MQTEVRPARSSDVGALVALENDVFQGDRISRRGFQSMVAATSADVLVAADATIVAGYCALLYRANSRKARLYSLASSPGRKGVGGALLAAAEAAARARGATAMRLEVRADNARAIALYERSGYRLFAQTADYYDDGATALRFEKPLAPPAAVERLPPVGTLNP